MSSDRTQGKDQGDLVARLERRVSALEAQIKPGQEGGVSGGRVAFSAFRDRDFEASEKGVLLKMTAILHNDGNGFDLPSGKFHAPTSGVYMFTFFTESCENRGALRMMVDGVHQVGAIAKPQANRTGQGGNVAIIHVNAGQYVWLETAWWDDYHSGGYDGERYASFSGVRLY